MDGRVWPAPAKGADLLAKQDVNREGRGGSGAAGAAPGPLVVGLLLHSTLFTLVSGAPAQETSSMFEDRLMIHIHCSFLATVILSSLSDVEASKISAR